MLMIRQCANPRHCWQSYKKFFIYLHPFFSTLTTRPQLFLSFWFAVLVFCSQECNGFIQVGKHGIIIEFTDPNYNTRRNATYLPEVAAHEGNFLLPYLSPTQNVVHIVYLSFSGACRTSWAARWTYWILSPGWTVVEAIDSLIRKAGYNGPITESLRKQIHLTRYQSTLFTMQYSEYVDHVKETRGLDPTINGVKPWTTYGLFGGIFHLKTSRWFWLSGR